jgi:hypothetical protein
MKHPELEEGSYVPYFNQDFHLYVSVYLDGRPQVALHHFVFLDSRHPGFKRNGTYVKSKIEVWVNGKETKSVSYAFEPTDIVSMMKSLAIETLNVPRGKPKEVAAMDDLLYELNAIRLHHQEEPKGARGEIEIRVERVYIRRPKPCTEDSGHQDEDIPTGEVASTTLIILQCKCTPPPFGRVALY